MLNTFVYLLGLKWLKLCTHQLAIIDQAFEAGLRTVIHVTTGDYQAVPGPALEICQFCTHSIQVMVIDLIPAVTKEDDTDLHYPLYQVAPDMAHTRQVTFT